MKFAIASVLAFAAASSTVVEAGTPITFTAEAGTPITFREIDHAEQHEVRLTKLNGIHHFADH
jgi:hypothetical protein